MIGIYKIQSKIDDKYYIGSSININKRWREHKYELKNNKHSNLHLQNFVNKYSLDNLEFTIIEECNIECLLIKEQDYLNALNSNTFNICKSCLAPMYNRKHSKETLKKMSISQSKENNPIFGTKRPKHVIDALLKANKGRVKSEEEKFKRLVNLPNRRPIVISRNDEIINCFSIAEAGKIIGVSSNSVSKGLKQCRKVKGWDCHPDPKLIETLKNLK